jgi:hypothetical protein
MPDFLPMVVNINTRREVLLPAPYRESMSRFSQRITRQIKTGILGVDFIAK